MADSADVFGSVSVVATCVELDCLNAHSAFVSSVLALGRSTLAAEIAADSSAVLVLARAHGIDSWAVESGDRDTLRAALRRSARLRFPDADDSRLDALVFKASKVMLDSMLDAGDFVWLVCDHCGVFSSPVEPSTGGHGSRLDG